MKQDILYKKAKKIVLKENNNSISYLQRTLGISYNRAATIIKELKETTAQHKAPI